MPKIIPVILEPKPAVPDNDLFNRFSREFFTPVIYASDVAASGESDLLTARNVAQAFSTSPYCLLYFIPGKHLLGTNEEVLRIISAAATEAIDSGLCALTERYGRATGEFVACPEAFLAFDMEHGHLQDPREPSALRKLMAHAPSSMSRKIPSPKGFYDPWAAPDPTPSFYGCA